MARHSGDVHIRRAIREDYEDAARLLSRFAYNALTPEERIGGFVQSSFTPAAIGAFDRSCAVMVALDRGQIVAVLCSNSLADADLPRPVAILKARLPQWRLDGMPIPIDATFCSGPVVIDRAHQGRGLLSPLYHALAHTAGPQYSTVVCFVVPENERSLRAHRQGLGMQVLGRFNADKMIALGRRIAQ
jgi:hypothetical protein